MWLHACHLLLNNACELWNLVPDFYGPFIVYNTLCLKMFDVCYFSLGYNIMNIITQGKNNLRHTSNNPSRITNNSLWFLVRLNSQQGQFIACYFK